VLIRVKIFIFIRVYPCPSVVKERKTNFVIRLQNIFKNLLLL